MRILFAVTHLGFLRNFESTLALLAERGHTVHLVTDRGAQGGVVDGMPIIERLQAAFPQAFTVETIRASKTDRWYRVSTGVREGLNYLRYLSPAFADAPKLRERGTAPSARTAGVAERLPGVRFAHGDHRAQSCAPTRRARHSVPARSGCGPRIASGLTCLS
jgi:hypothetical protein